MANDTVPEFIEQAEYEKGFAAHYRQHIAPLLANLEVKRKKALRNFIYVCMGGLVFVVLWDIVPPHIAPKMFNDWSVIETLLAPPRQRNNAAPRNSAANSGYHSMTVQQADATCMNDLIRVANVHNYSVEKYIAQSQPYLKQCREYYARPTR